MRDFRVGEAVGAGFRLLWRQPLSALAWFAFLVVSNVLLIALFVAVLGSAALGVTVPTSAPAGVDPVALSQQLAAIGRQIIASLLVAPFYIAITATMLAAITRAGMSEA